MKRKRIDIQQDLIMFFLRPLVFIWMWFDAKRKVIRDKKFSFCRREPYVILANHTYLFDVVHVPLRLMKVPFIIGSHTLFSDNATKFLMTQVAHVIPKSKGKSDIGAMLKIFAAVKKGYPILIFPEGDTTFYGETGYIEEATMKLVKKLKLDVVTCNVRGGYTSRPRWSTGKRSRHYIELEYKLTIPKAELSDMSVADISDIVKKELYHNDYEFQRKRLIPHKGKQLAEGLENVVYVCPHCEAINSIESHGNTFHCNSCKKEGYIDQYGFIHDFIYDNLVDWNKFQLNHSDKLRESELFSEGELSFINMETHEKNDIGRVKIHYHDQMFSFSGAYEKDIPLANISNPTITLRRDFGFIFEDINYKIRLDKYSTAFLRTAQSKY